MLRAAALCLAALGAVSHASKTEYHRYLVVGAGPGGLQMGHYLDTAGRDYLILDKVRHRVALVRLTPSHPVTPWITHDRMYPSDPSLHTAERYPC